MVGYDRIEKKYYLIWIQQHHNQIFSI
jgi:hypothetical protein